MALEADGIDRNTVMAEAIEQREEILSATPSERRRYLGARIVEDQHGLGIGRARGTKRNIDVARTERPQPHAVTQPAGLAMVRPDRLVDHVPGMNAPRVPADSSLDVIDENALRIGGRNGRREPPGIRFLPREAVTPQLQSVG